MSGSRAEPGLPVVQRVAAVAWPSFLAAGGASVVFFTFLDPLVLFACEGEAPWSRTAAYSVGFFCFWTLCAISSSLSLYFARPAAGPAGADRDLAS